MKIGKKKPARVYYIQVKQNILDILLDVLLLMPTVNKLFLSLPLPLFLKNTKKLFVDIRELIGNRRYGRRKRREEEEERGEKGILEILEKSYARLFSNESERVKRRRKKKKGEYRFLHDNSGYRLTRIKHKGRKVPCAATNRWVQRDNA